MTRRKKRKNNGMGGYNPTKETYLTRWYVLRELGFKSYQQYLISELWATIRAQVLFDAVCRVCKSDATEVHHMSYKHHVMLGKDLSKLIPICQTCHKHIEFDGTYKRTLDEANHYLFDILNGKFWRVALMEGRIRRMPDKSCALCRCKDAKKYLKFEGQIICIGCYIGYKRGVGMAKKAHKAAKKKALQSDGVVNDE